MMRTRERFFIILFSVCVLQLVYYWPLMQERGLAFRRGEAPMDGRQASFACMPVVGHVHFHVPHSAILLRRFLIPSSVCQSSTAGIEAPEAFSLIAIVSLRNGTLIFCLTSTRLQANLKTCFACLQKHLVPDNHLHRLYLGLDSQHHSSIQTIPKKRMMGRRADSCNL
jgi:hypothetical protein